MLTNASAAIPTTRHSVKPARPRLGNTWQDVSWRTAQMTQVLLTPFVMREKSAQRRRKFVLRRRAPE